MKGEGTVPTTRLWIATAMVVLTVIAVWLFIDYRTQPPPPPGENKKVISEPPSPEASAAGEVNSDR